MSSIINATTTAGVTVTGDNSGSLQLATNNGTTALTIDNSQRVAFVAGTAALPAITTTGDTNTGIFFSAADTIDFAEGGTACGQFDSSANFKFNSGYGSVATAYGCRAWVQFDGTSGTVNGSGNISSVSRTGTGDYSITFTNNMSDANYAVVGSSSPNSGYGQVTFVETNSVRNTGSTTTNTTSNFKISTLNSTSSVQVDALIVNVAVFR